MEQQTSCVVRTTQNTTLWNNARIPTEQSDTKEREDEGGKGGEADRMEARSGASAQASQETFCGAHLSGTRHTRLGLAGRASHTAVRVAVG